jgi:hypothetical protein
MEEESMLKVYATATSERGIVQRHNAIIEVIIPFFFFINSNVVESKLGKSMKITKAGRIRRSIGT